MSEKLKGMLGSKTRANEVLKWLKSQGANEHTYKGNDEDSIYFVYRGLVKIIDIKYSFLLDIVELPRWRAEKGERYYYIDEFGEIHSEKEVDDSYNYAIYKYGNYFRTLEEAELYAEKVREIFKERI